MKNRVIGALALICAMISIQLSCCASELKVEKTETKRFALQIIRVNEIH